MTRSRLPVATYRLQLTPRFGFAAASRALDHLATLGISHVYLSPIFEARRGSTHGYDGTDPRRVRSELGGMTGFRAFVRAARRLGLRIVIDIVPNHLATSPQGGPFLDVLRRGPRSRYAHWFDIDWARGAPDGGTAIVLPRLERPFEEALRCGEIAFGNDGKSLRHGSEAFPWCGERDAHAAQNYRLVPWREGMAHLNYARFLDIADLIRVRVEEREVFAATHELATRLIADEAIDGLRIDHLDGLEDGNRYLDALWRLVPRARRNEFLIVAEASAERFSGVATTGYDFLSATTCTVLDRAEVRAFDRVANGEESPAEMRRACRRVVRELFAPEIGSQRHPERTARYLESKAIEDTLLFRDSRTLALNELGHDPHAARRRLGLPVLRDLLVARSPTSLNATSTHDTKRSEDVRARLIALTAHAREYAELVAAIVASGDWPRSLGRSELHYAVQTILAAWPEDGVVNESFIARIVSHLEKAAREAKRHSSWSEPDLEFERAWGDAARRWIERTRAPWRPAFDALRESIVTEGERIALTWLAWKCFLPGIPDFYQGAESTLLCLTDPDNRSAVDFGALRVAESRKARATRCWLTVRARLASRTLLAPARFLGVSGRAANRVVAFSRGSDLIVVTCGARASARLRLPRGEYYDAFQGRRSRGGEVEVSELCGTPGVAVLECESG